MTQGTFGFSQRTFVQWVGSQGNKYHHDVITEKSSLSRHVTMFLKIDKECFGGRKLKKGYVISFTVLNVPVSLNLKIIYLIT